MSTGGWELPDGSPCTSAIPAKKITTSRTNLLNPTDLQLNEEITVQTWMNGEREEFSFNQICNKVGFKTK